MHEDEILKGMVCLYPDRQTAEVLALRGAPDGVDVIQPDDLHVTLCYFKVARGDVATMIGAAAGAASFCMTDAITTRVEGVAQFGPDSDGRTPHVLLFDPTLLYPIAESLRQYSASKHGFIPHMTLAYAPAGRTFVVADPALIPITFDAISIKIGDEIRYDFPLAVPMANALMTVRDLEVDDEAGSTNAESRPALSNVSRLPNEDASVQMHETTKAGKRLQGRMRERLGRVMSDLKGVMDWAGYEDEEDMHEEHHEEDEESEKDFVVYKDDLGRDRWVAYSSTAFKDKQQEIVSTKALEDAVVRGDTTGERGTLRLWHIKGADIGVCDFQAIEGRILVESGTFYDTPAAESFKEYARTTDDELGVSVGFVYPESTFDGEVYGEARIYERSVLPLDSAANPYTSFSLKEGAVMIQKKSSWLAKAVGEDNARSIIERAESTSKELEGLVAFKDHDVEAVPEEEAEAPSSGGPDVTGAIEALKAAVRALEGGAPDDEEDEESDESEEGEAPEEGDEEADKASAVADVADAGDGAGDGATEAIKELVAIIGPGLAAIQTLVQGQKSIEERLTAIESAKAAEKAQDHTPKGAAFRPTTSPDNILDNEAVLKGLDAVDAPTSPIKPFLDDLLGQTVGAAR